MGLRLVYKKKTNVVLFVSITLCLRYACSCFMIVSAYEWSSWKLSRNVQVIFHFNTLFYSFSQFLWLNSRIFFFSRNNKFGSLNNYLLVHIRLEFIIDLSKFQMLWHMCADSKYNRLHMVCRFSLKLSNSSQLLNHFSSCKPSHSKQSIQLSKTGVHTCIFHKYLTLTLFVMSAKLANDL